MTFDYSGAGMTKCIKAESAAVIPTGDKDDPLFVTSVAPQYVPTAFYDISTGLPLLARILCVNGAIETPYTLGYINQNGEFIVTTGNAVGTNSAAPKNQFVGTFHTDLIAAVGGGDVTKTAADLIADAIAAGVMLQLDDGTSRALAATDWIARIDMDLKPVGGHGDTIGAQVTSTTANATFEDGSTYNLDPGGSATAGAIKSANGFYLKSNFENLVVADGSIVVVGIEFASTPA